MSNYPMIRNTLTVLLANLSLVICIDAYAYGEWQAKVIDVKGDKHVVYKEDYAQEKINDSWDFAEGDMEGATITGAITQEIKEHRLNIRTSSNTQIRWGDFDLNAPEKGELTVGKQWSQQAWPWVVQIKLKQKMDISDWYVEAAYRVHGKIRKIKKTKKLIGKKDAILQFDMGISKRAYHSIKVGTNTPGNIVAIDWVRVVRPSLSKTYLYKFNVPGKPLSAKFAYSANGKTEFFLNEQLVKDSGGMGPYNKTLGVYEGIDNIKQGENLICLHVEGIGAYQNPPNYGDQFFFMQGTVFDDQGNSVLVKTDRAWFAQYGARQCNTRQLPLKKATVVGTIRKRWPILRNMNEKYRYDERPYQGRIELKYASGEYPIFGVDEDIALNIKLIGIGSNQPDTTITTTLRNINGRSSGNTINGKKLTGANNGIINFGSHKEGNYELIIKYYQDGSLRDERRQELVIVGPIPQATGTTAEKEITAILFNKKTTHKTLCGTADGKSAFINPENRSFLANLTRYPNAYYTDHQLVLPPERAAWCSVQFKVNQLYKPHRIRVEFPEGDYRNMIFAVAEESRFNYVMNVGKSGAIVRLSTGVHTSEAESTTTAYADFIYWPNNKNATFTIVNAGRAWLDRGAIRSVTVTELDDLPAFENQIQNSNSYIGPFVERIDRSTPRLFYSGPLEARFSREIYNVEFPGYYQAWHNTISNLIKYLKYSGQNSYFAGIYMYYGGWFPSPEYEGYAKGWKNLPPGWRDGAFALMTKMFEMNQLNIILGVQFIGNRELIAQDVVSNGDALEGRRAPRFISALGNQVHGFQNQGFNFLLPEVKEEILTLAEKIAEHYSQYSAVKGITWMRQPEFPRDAGGNLGQRSPIKTGYGDYTINAYINETGSRLPDPINKKKRFVQRYRWLMDNEKEQWLNWRCKKVYETDKEIYTILSRHRPDWKFWRVLPRPVPEEIKEWMGRRLSFKDVYRYGGNCTALYENDDQMHTMRMLDIGVDRKYKKRSMQIGSLSDDAKRFFEMAATKASLSGEDIHAHVGFMFEQKIKNNTKWPWSNMLVVGYSIPSTDGLRPTLGNPDGRSAAGGRSISIGWSDVGHFFGAEKDIKSYIRQRRKSTGPSSQ
ncbi:MAG: hypothetical protein ABW168_27365 [Sedimenticola sp.]